MAQKTIPIIEIALDSSNVRLSTAGVLKGEKEIIAHLINKEKIYGMAKHIAEHGISPIEVPGVVIEDKGYVMLEGNRRLCALKLLNDPSLAGDQKRRRSRYQNLAHNAASPVPTKLKCQVFSSREEGAEWMSVKHISNQPAGIRPWGATEKALHDIRSPSRLAALIKLFAQSNNLFSKEVISKVSTTTLTRYLQTSSVRNTMGIERTDAPNILQYSCNKTTFKKYVKVFINDEIDKVLSSRSTLKERDKYATYLAKKVSALNVRKNILSGRVTKVRNITPAIIIVQSTSENDKGIIASNWPGFAHLGNHDQDARIRSVVTELRDIDTNKFPFASGCLLRMLMEVSIRRFLGYSTTDKIRLPALYREAEMKLQAMSNKHATAALRKAISDIDSYLSPDTHNAWVHCRLVPEQAELERVWINFSPIINLLLKLAPKGARK